MAEGEMRPVLDIVTKCKRAIAVRRGGVEQYSRAGTPTKRAWAPYGQSVKQLVSYVLVQYVNYLVSARSWAKPACRKTSCPSRNQPIVRVSRLGIAALIAALHLNVISDLVIHAIL
jgi:hypothetical protein